MTTTILLGVRVLEGCGLCEAGVLAGPVDGRTEALIARFVSTPILPAIELVIEMEAQGQ